jgi:hypothetical protein
MGEREDGGYACVCVREREREGERERGGGCGQKNKGEKEDKKNSARAAPMRAAVCIGAFIQTARRVKARRPVKQEVSEI